jgi:hypothetical protein
MDAHAADVVPPVALEPESVHTNHQQVLAPCLDAALLDLEEVGEVRAGRDRDGAGRRFAGQVAQDEVFPHPVPDVAVAEHEERAVRTSRPGLCPGDEGGGERLALHRRQRLRWQVIDQELPPGQESGVAEEQPVRLVRRDVTGPAAHTEARALDQGDRPAQGRKRRGFTGEGPADRHPVSRSTGRVPAMRQRTTVCTGRSDGRARAESR